ncbi:hypothetical protein M569_14811, partial [Genlisea aurea]
LLMGIAISLVLLFTAIGILFIIHVCIVGRALRAVDGDTGENNGGLNAGSMSHDDIEKLPCFDFTEKKGTRSPGPDCAVCLEGFKEGEKCRLLPSCKHSFHVDCVDVWLSKSSQCPVCRTSAHPSFRAEETRQIVL